MVGTVFLDRDGVINVDSPDYIKNSAEFHFIPRSAEAVALLSCSGFRVIIITNQSVIGRKLAGMEQLEAIFAKMKKGVARFGGRIEDIFFCPHTPEDGCSCRKPKPGLIDKAARRYGIDPASSCMVGDSAKDMECAANAGCRFSLLVRTGNGETAAGELAARGMPPDYTGADLMECARWICTRLKNADPAL
ncbi:MAG: D-glycero-beta-D-manno-heptose 1,7-bisphosphate 7-phosphatase [Desulfobacteraceae bacterium]